MSELVRHRLQWWNPYTHPPEGMPRVLAEEITERSQPSRVVYALWYPGCGYCCGWELLDATPPRKLSETAKQSLRRKSLARRIERKAPLFAADLIADELKRQPTYFGLEVGA